MSLRGSNAWENLTAEFSGDSQAGGRIDRHRPVSSGSINAATIGGKNGRK